MLMPAGRLGMARRVIILGILRHMVPILAGRVRGKCSWNLGVRFWRRGLGLIQEFIGIKSASDPGGRFNPAGHHNDQTLFPESDNDTRNISAAIFNLKRQSKTPGIGRDYNNRVRPLPLPSIAVGVE